VSSLSDRCNRAELEVSRLNAAVQQLSREKMILEDEFREVQRANDTVSRRTVTDKEELKRNYLVNQEAQRKIDDLQLLITHLETNVKVQAEKNVRLISSLEDADGSLRQLEEQSEILRDKLSEKDRIIAAHVAKISHLTEEHNHLTDSMEHEAIKAAQVIRRCNMLEQQLAQAKANNESLETRQHDVHADLVRAQNDCATLDKRIAALREENLELKKRVGMQASQLGGAEEDILLMTRENQALTAGRC
jgi:chromosome segregation ATPase